MYTNVSVCEEGSVDQGFGLMINTLPFADSNDKIINKTKLIEQLLGQWGKVNLFTIPRRFGKILNMSMLKYFFEIGTDQTLFDGLYISQNQEFCEEYMEKFPVIFLSLKGVDGLTFFVMHWFVSGCIWSKFVLK